MTDFSITTGQAKLLNPNMALSASRGARYPNQFFDLAQQYMPPTIKELFRWCTFYFYNSPLIGSSIKKISRYPITDLLFEDEHDSVKNAWNTILVDELKLKDRLMEVNLDYHVYGNAFVSVHLPFTRFLICRNQRCRHRAPIRQWEWSFKGGDYQFSGKCEQCGHAGAVDVKDVPYKDRKSIRLIRWNPENIHIKYNEYTGRYIYMYQVPGKLKRMIERGDKDILEDIPLIVLEALKKRRLIRLDDRAIKHLKNPTLAEQDQGWGKPTILHVLKDMYYFYTLRRAQEAIALEHIVPFDIIYPLPNAQADPYIHTDLADWRVKIEGVIERHRRDPNFKAVIPIPIGFGRLGGDGKALLLSPELNYLTQTIVGGMGIPQEFLFGGLNFTGSSISLRTLENDFIQNRSQLLDLVYWIKDKIRIWLGLPDVKRIRFADFRMADDVQRNQQVVGLNAQGKLSDHTMLTELGFDYEVETKKKIEELYIQNYIMDLQSKGAAKSQGEASVIQFNYQQKVQDLMTRAQEGAQQRMADMAGSGALPPPAAGGQPGQPALPAPAGAAAAPNGSQSGMAGASLGAVPGQTQPGQAGARQGASGKGQQPVDPIQQRIERWASQLVRMPPDKAKLTINEIKVKMPEVGQRLEQLYQMQLAEMSGATTTAPNMDPLPQGRVGAQRMELVGARPMTGAS